MSQSESRATSKPAASTQYPFALACVTVFTAIFGCAASGADGLTVEPAERAVIVVEADIAVRNELPATLFGFNVQHYNFQNDLWQKGEHAADERVTEALRFFPGALYRYPGGLVANRFWWEESVGPVADRAAQKIVSFAPAGRVLFGVEEYVDFVDSVGGQPWYVLNLSGWDSEAMFRELPEQTIAESNAQLAKLLKKELGDTPRYYQLGNELDRADYQWPHDKYVKRARSTISAIHAVDPDARFIAFLREFDWQYRGTARQSGVSKYQQFIADVLQGLPSVNDFSLHFYYDDPGMQEKSKQIPWRLQQFQRAIDAASQQRDGKTPNVWITEHARGLNMAAGKPMQRARFTSNQAAAVSTGDILIALAQMPAVKGAAWHGLNAGPWQLFDATTRYNDLRPRPVYWGLRVLRALNLPVVLRTTTRSPNRSGYAGGYDVRAVGFASDTGDALGLWVVNRASEETAVELRVASWKGRPVEIRHRYLAGDAGVDADDLRLTPEIELDPPVSNKTFSGSGSLQIALPPSSVSSLLITNRASP